MKVLIPLRVFNRPGVISASGPHWKDQRKVSLEILREMGLGKNVLADRVQEEVKEYVKDIAVLQGKPFDPKELTHVSVSNNICSVVFGRRFEYDDPTFLQYMACVESNFKNITIPEATVLDFVPLLKHLPGDLFKTNIVLGNVPLVRERFIRPHLESHMKDFNSDTEEVRDFIEGYLRDSNKVKGTTATLDDENLMQVTADLFAAGTETTAATIRWALVYFLHYPQVQEKCFQEIQTVVGTERAPTIRDRPALTYVEATIMEVLRRADIVPLSVQHGLLQDVDFMGYRRHYHPVSGVGPSRLEIFSDPLTARPERFLDTDGKLIKPEEFIPFSLGRRVCLGEVLARAELFLYLSAMIQRFHFLPPETGELPSLKGILGLSAMPESYRIRAVARD